MEESLLLQVKHLAWGSGTCQTKGLRRAVVSHEVPDLWTEGLPENLKPELMREPNTMEQEKDSDLLGYYYYASRADATSMFFLECRDAVLSQWNLKSVEKTLGQNHSERRSTLGQGYRICIGRDYILIIADDFAGLCYGIQTLSMLARNQNDITQVQIEDYPTLKKRGLMLDVSRGRVLKLSTLKRMIQRLARMRYNVFQLYIEHTFLFRDRPEMSEGTDPLTAEDILELQVECEKYGIELQPCLQSLGHFRHILSIPEYEKYSEGGMLWSLDSTSKEVDIFLDSLYGELLPLFHSETFNVCMDEPYDLGSGKNAGFEGPKELLYIHYMNMIHDLAQKYGKRIMVFDDVFLHHPEYLDRCPSDVIFADWCYDPQESFGTPARIAASGHDYYICPGTGNWNTLFPRLDGALMNIRQLMREGCAHGASGMMLTDWNDHGGYTMLAPTLYIYAYAGRLAWEGRADESDEEKSSSDYLTRWLKQNDNPDERRRTGKLADMASGIQGLADVIATLGNIYRIVPYWSKNRSECVMALFDEPVFGNAVNGPVAPVSVRAYDLNLPDGIKTVLEKHSQHPLRPYFQITEKACAETEAILGKAAEQLKKVERCEEKEELSWILEAFSTMLKKLAYSRKMWRTFAGDYSKLQLLGLENELYSLMRDYAVLECHYLDIWNQVAKTSEIQIVMSYFGHILAALDNLREWLADERTRFMKEGTRNHDFSGYSAGGYTTLPTF